MSVFKLYILVFSVLVSLYFFYKEYEEIMFLRRKLKKIIGKSRIESLNDLVQIKNFLQSTISYNANLKNNARPLLRYTATQILTSKYGFCGENARVAIKLFILGGIKARRIYLFRKEWQHVLIEHEFKDKWYMFDGHYDPSSLLTDSDVAKIPSEQISLYPNDYKSNPYLEFCRIKLFYKIDFFKPFSRIKLSKPIIYTAESPFLIKGFAMSLLSIVILALL
jgi:hypothetical protein